MTQWNTVIWGSHWVHLPSPASLKFLRNTDIKKELSPHSLVLQKLLLMLQSMFTLMVYLSMRGSSMSRRRRAAMSPLARTVFVVISHTRVLSLPPLVRWRLTAAVRPADVHVFLLHWVSHDLLQPAMLTACTAASVFSFIRQHFLIPLQNNEALIESLHLQSVNATQSVKICGSFNLDRCHCFISSCCI